MKLSRPLSRLTTASAAMAAVLLALSSCGVQKQLAATNAGFLTPEEITARYSPEGTVTEEMHGCSVPGPSKRRMIVYLPKGYEADTLRYPVLYVIHGARGNETSWITKGEILALTDSLRAEGKAKPCIIVFPNLNQYKDDADYGYSRAKKAVESLFDVDGAAESVFVEDVVAFVDSAYRTIPDKEHRAIAGMSIGALQSIFISAWNPDTFGYVGMFSPMYKSPPRHGSYAWFYGKLKDNQKIQFRYAPLVYDIEIGRSDFFYPHMQNYRRYLEKCGYEYQYFECPGGHEWYNWVRFYGNFLQMLF